ncbi:MAG TPA: 50S ribosomal protein L27 [Candidatus Woesebacteria bacterium]|nr:50S ribosomal protein L27 [Candidatus Woesebacteria bacterium]
MAHTKSTGAVKGNRDSIAKRLGVKLFGGEVAKTGSIIVRQRGTKYHPGNGTSIGKDDTIYAMQPGKVAFKKLRGKQYVEVING